MSESQEEGGSVAKRSRRWCEKEQSKERGVAEKVCENKKWSGGVREGMRRTVLVTQKAVPAVQSMMTV